MSEDRQLRVSRTLAAPPERIDGLLANPGLAPGPVPPEKVGELQAVLTPLGTTVTGPPLFDPT